MRNKDIDRSEKEHEHRGHDRASSPVDGQADIGRGDSDSFAVFPIARLGLTRRRHRGLHERPHDSRHSIVPLLGEMERIDGGIGGFDDRKEDSLRDQGYAMA